MISSSGSVICHNGLWDSGLENALTGVIINIIMMIQMKRYKGKVWKGSEQGAFVSLDTWRWAHHCLSLWMTLAVWKLFGSDCFGFLWKLHQVDMIGYPTSSPSALPAGWRVWPNAIEFYPWCGLSGDRPRCRSSPGAYQKSPRKLRSIMSGPGVKDQLLEWKMLATPLSLRKLNRKLLGF